MTKKLALGISLLALATACGNSKSSGQLNGTDVSTAGNTSVGGTSDTSSGSNGSTDGSTNNNNSSSDVLPSVTPPAEVPGTAGIYVRGVNNSLWSSLTMPIESITVTVNGVSVPVDVTLQQLPDLAQDISWRAGTIPTPAAGSTAVV